MIIKAYLGQCQYPILQKSPRYAKIKNRNLIYYAYEQERLTIKQEKWHRTQNKINEQT